MPSKRKLFEAASSPLINLECVARNLHTQVDFYNTGILNQQNMV